MKKIFFLIVSLIMLVPVFLYAEEAAAPAEKFPWAPVVLLSSDALLITASVLAIVQQNTLATDYNTLKTSLGDLDEAEYWRLKYEKERVTAAEDLVLISTITAGAALAYTAVDYFWLHHVFGDGVKVTTGFNPVNKGYCLMVNTKF